LRLIVIVTKDISADQDVGKAGMAELFARNAAMMISVTLNSISQKQIHLDVQMVHVEHVVPGHEIMCGHVTIGGHVMYGQNKEDIQPVNQIFSVPHVEQ